MGRCNNLGLLKSFLSPASRLSRTSTLHFYRYILLFMNSLRSHRRALTTDDCDILKSLLQGVPLAGMAQKFTFVVGLGAESQKAVASLLFDTSDIPFHTTCEMAVRK